MVYVVSGCGHVPLSVPLPGCMRGFPGIPQWKAYEMTVSEGGRWGGHQNITVFTDSRAPTLPFCRLFIRVHSCSPFWSDLALVSVMSDTTAWRWVSQSN